MPFKRYGSKSTDKHLSIHQHAFTPPDRPSRTIVLRFRPIRHPLSSFKAGDPQPKCFLSVVRMVTMSISSAISSFMFVFCTMHRLLYPAVNRLFRATALMLVPDYHLIFLPKIYSSKTHPHLSYTRTIKILQAWQVHTCK